MSKTTATADLFDSGVSGKSSAGPADTASAAGEFTADQLRAAGSRLSVSLVAAGQMERDEAMRYYSLIKNLFPSAQPLDFDMALFAWGCLQGTGASTDYSGAAPLVVAGRSVAAVKFAGEIIPIDSRGLLRKFFSTTFEKKAQEYLNAIPRVRDIMAARAAKAGDPGGDCFHHIDFVKGVDYATKGAGAARIRAKDALLSRRSGGAPIPNRVAQPEVSFEPAGPTNGLYG